MLVEGVLHEARALGYRMARLDTMAFMTSAQALYHSLGFYDVEPYRPLSETVRPYICFLEIDLTV
jgi:hypothetical protein